MPDRRPAATARLARELLNWYDRSGRDLPWRVKGGGAVDPYRVLVSEVMLQQTTVAAVMPRFAAFIGRWPTVQALAAAPVEDVMQAWAGLGYYARARNLHVCAQAIAAAGGMFPRDETALRRLPGIGDYTAAALAAIAFDQPAMPVDGNVLRVVARLAGIDQPLPAAKPAIAAAARSLMPPQRPGDFAQALMDLGATICLARQPRCTLCPWSGPCVARATGAPERLPVRSPKPQRPQRHGVAFWIGRGDGTVLLRRRPAKGLLGGMMEFPGTPWSAEPWLRPQAEEHAPLPAAWHWLDKPVAHTFTHFHLHLQVAAGTADGSATAADGIWQPLGRLDEAALPSVMRKVAAAVLARRDQEGRAHES